MSALAEQLDRLSHRADHVDIERAVEGALEAAASPTRTPSGRRRARATFALVVAASVLTVVGLAAVAGRDRDVARGGPATELSTSPASAPAELTEEELTPVVTLDPDRMTSEDPPVTVMATGPSEWYELQPDLDVAWYSTGSESWLCFRSPLGQECRPDRFAPAEYGGDGPLLVATGGGQALIVTIDPGDDITVTLSSDATLRVPVSRDSQINWGIARIDLPPGETVNEASVEYLFDRPDATPDESPPAAAGRAPSRGLPRTAVGLS